jgi:hypothetical protein
MGTTQLQLYNLALLHITDRNLSSTTDAVSARYALDDAYAGAIDHCLSQGYWNFAMRQSEETDDAASVIGYAYSFTKPADCVRLYNLYADASLSVPLLRYEDRGGKWFAESMSPITPRSAAGCCRPGRSSSPITSRFIWRG